MKKILSLVIAMMMISVANAQDVDYTDIYATNQKLAKLTQEARTKKATKDAKKEEKRLLKEGWKPMPGKLPIARQLDRVYNMTYELDANGCQAYIIGNAIAKGETVGVAQIAASTQAREQIASNLGVSITSLISRQVKNQEQSTTAISVDEISEKSKQIFSQNLGKSNPVLELYRELPEGVKEYQISIVYSIKDSKDVIREKLKTEINADIDSLIF